MKSAVFIFLAMMMMSVPALASPWNTKKGQVQLITNTFYYTTDTYYTVQGDKRKQDDFTKVELNSYIEYGYRDDITLGGSLSFQQLSQRNPFTLQDEDNQGVDGVELFARKKLWQGRNAVISVQPMLRTPRLTSTGSFPELGEDFWSGELRILGGYGFGGQKINPYFVTAELGYRMRTEGAADQIRTQLGGGWHMAPRWMLLGNYTRIDNFGGYGVGAPVITPESNYSLHKLEASAVFSLNKSYAFQLGAFQHVYARNTGAGGGALFSLWHKF